MTSNEERISRLEGIAEVTQSQLGEIRSEMRAMRQDIQAEMGGLRTEIHSTRQDLQAEIGELRTEIRSTRNTTLMVNLVLWMTTIGTLFGLFFGLR